jgi:cytochrome P450
MRVIGALVGIPDEYLLTLRDQVEESARLKEEKPQEEQRLPSIGEPYAPFLEFKKANPADDFLTTLIEARFKDVLTGEQRDLSDAEILNYVGMLYAAGVETTARLIGWLGKTLADNPDQRALVVADKSLINKTVEETLRYEVPSPIQVRVTTRPVELHGQTVDGGKIVTLLTGAANRDPAAFPDPDTFDIRRKMDAHMTFGKGVHYCFGAALARIEGRIALEEILDRFPKWDLDLSGAELIHTATIRGYHKLPWCSERPARPRACRLSPAPLTAVAHGGPAQSDLVVIRTPLRATTRSASTRPDRSDVARWSRRRAG